MSGLVKIQNKNIVEFLRIFIPSQQIKGLKKMRVKRKIKVNQKQSCLRLINSFKEWK